MAAVHGFQGRGPCGVMLELHYEIFLSVRASRHLGLESVQKYKVHSRT